MIFYESDGIYGHWQQLPFLGECQEITKGPVSSWQKIKKDFWEVSRLETFDEQHGVFRIDAAEVQLREEDVPKLVSQKPWVGGLDACVIN